MDAAIEECNLFLHILEYARQQQKLISRILPSLEPAEEPVHPSMSLPVSVPKLVFEPEPKPDNRWSAKLRRMTKPGPKQKRKRTRLTKQQRERLERLFLKDKYPQGMYTAYATKLNLRTDTVKSWFARRRQKERAGAESD